jgi:class 3 adenylate cyclase
MYAIFENASSPNQYFDLGSFLSDPSHVFVTIAIPILGLSLGISDVIVKRYQTQLQEVSGKLKTYSEWSLGPKLLDQLLADSNALALRRVQRTVLFMDIRGFTRWSEHHAPEFVVDMLNQYYRESEEVLISLNARKYKFNADEVMAVFEDALTAIQAAEALQTRVSKWLAPYELGAGIGIHMGHLVEGLLGTRGVRIFDVIGDTVNTAKRLESAAERGEILLSETLFNAHQTGIATNQPREISVKGKTNSLNVYPLART